jgi:phage baseplate assembly protein W
MMRMSEKTGKWLDGDQALDQAIHRILRTPKGSMVLNRNFGSMIFDYVDMPVMEAKAHISHELFRCMGEFLPQFKIEKLGFGEEKDSLSLTITGSYAGRPETTIKISS